MRTITKAFALVLSLAFATSAFAEGQQCVKTTEWTCGDTYIWKIPVFACTYKTTETCTPAPSPVS